MRSYHAVTVARAFPDWRHGQQSLHELLDAGFEPGQLGIAARAGEKWTWDSNSSSSENDGMDAGVLWDLGLAAGILPDVGPVIAGGMLASIVFTDRKHHSGSGIRCRLQDAGVVQDVFPLERAFMEGRTIVAVHSTHEAFLVVSAIAHTWCRLKKKRPHMRDTRVSLPTIALIAGTRMALGIGLGLLLAERLDLEQRRAAGLALVIVGGLATIPLVAEVLAARQQPGIDGLMASQTPSLAHS
jgi:hypothetical protein